MRLVCDFMPAPPTVHGGAHPQDGSGLQVFIHLHENFVKTFTKFFVRAGALAFIGYDKKTQGWCGSASSPARFANALQAKRRGEFSNAALLRRRQQQGLQKFSFTVMDTAPGTTSARVLPAAVFCCLRRATCGLARGLDMDLIRFV